MKNIERIAEELFDKVRSRFENVVLGDKDTNDTDDPAQARFFNFDYISGTKENYGNITLSLIDEDSLKIYFSKSVNDKLEENEVDQDEWFNFLKGLRYFAKRNLLMFDTRDISRNNLTVRDLKSVSKTTSSYTSAEASDTVIESVMRGTSRVSIQEMGGVKLIIHHSGAIDENIPGARSRMIDSIFVETAQGERFLMPFKKLSAARAMAEHISHGGYMHDSAGKHIIGMVEEMGSLAFFVRNTRHRMFEDSETQAMVESAIDRYYMLRDNLKRMSTIKGYRHFAETFQPLPNIQNEFDVDALKERFVKKFFDERITQALPYVHRAYQQKLESGNNRYIQEFDSWADNIAEADSENIDTMGITNLMQRPVEVGLDGLDAINAVKEFIPDDDELFAELEELSQVAGTDADARPLINRWLSKQGYPMFDLNSTEKVDSEQGEPVPPEPETPPEPNRVPESVVRDLRRLAGI